MKYFMMLALLGAATLGAITLVDPQGVETQVAYDELVALPRQDVETVREKDGELRRDIWQGIRFDLWLKPRLLDAFNVIRFESEDRYMVSLSKAEWDTLACWLVFGQGGKVFEEQSLRLIFPALRDQKWVRGLDRVVLENFDPLKLPARFEFLDQKLSADKLVQDPAPFVNAKGYYFKDLLPLSAREKSCPVVLYSQDGMKLALDYPFHLEGAILEVTDDGFNLKSPQIPGGMWLKRIIFIQMGDTALIDTHNIDTLVALNRVMDWQLSPAAKFLVESADGARTYPLAEILARPELLDGVKSFSLVP